MADYTWPPDMTSSRHTVIMFLFETREPDVFYVCTEGMFRTSCKSFVLFCRLSKEVDVTEEAADADDKFSSVTSAVRKQTHNSSDNLQGENNNLELQVTDILDEFKSSGDSESSDTQMKKSALGLRRSEFDTRHVDDYTNRDRSEKRRRFITRNAQAVRDSDSLPGSTESESMFETAPSAPSSTEPVRRKVRKDKSALRKSCLNRHEDDSK